MTHELHAFGHKLTVDEQGAEWKQLQLKAGKYVLWNIDTRFWNKTAPILFPTVGKLKDDTYIYENKIYHLPRHGFARDKSFELMEKTATSLTFRLLSDTESLMQYPFPFELILKYNLSANSLNITYIVNNTGFTPLYYSLGAHPAFMLEANLSDYCLQFSKPYDQLERHLLAHDLFSGNTAIIPLHEGKLCLNDDLFTQDAIVLKEKITQLSLKKGNHTLFDLHFEGFNYLGIWTKPKAPFLCIEPWAGIADNQSHNQQFTEKEGIEKLLANDTKTYCITLDFTN